MVFQSGNMQEFSLLQMLAVSHAATMQANGDAATVSSSFPVTESTEPAILPTHNGS